MTKESHIIYKTNSLYAEIKLLIARLVILILIGVAIYHYVDNPTFVAVFVFILLLLFLFTGNETIFVCKDKFIYQPGSLFKKILSKKVFEFKDIKSVSIEGNHSKIFDIITNGSRLYNKMYIEDNSGDLKIIRTNIFIEDLREVTKSINHQLEKFKC